MPAKFWIYNDSLYLKCADIYTYKITKQADYLLKFVNENGDEVKLVKSDNKLLKSDFDYHVYAVNTFQKQKSDTIVKTDADIMIVVFLFLHLPIESSNQHSVIWE